MMEEAWISQIAELGIVVSLVIFLVWRDKKRDDTDAQERRELIAYIRGEMKDTIEKNTAVLEKLTDGND